ncbi:MAG: hypothetical protein ACHQ0J_04950 [Candidatus Dormibacterales bacterium]
MSAVGALPVAAGVDCEVALTTTADPESATIGSVLKDNATLASAFDPTGTITFNLFDPSQNLAGTQSVAVDGNKVYSTPSGYVATTLGQWTWKVTYSGDDHNSGLAARDEHVNVTPARPTITTTPLPAAAEVGATLNDSATLLGGYNPTGTITFTLKDKDGDKAGTPETVTVALVDGKYTASTAVGFKVDQPGKWFWTAEYSGDTNNKPATSSEPEVVIVDPITPKLTTTPAPATAQVGDVLNDTATLTGFDNPKGKLVFGLYNSPTAAAPVWNYQVDANGNGTYATVGGFAANQTGQWHWTVKYDCSTENEGRDTATFSSPNCVENGCVTATDEQVLVTQRQPVITTTPNPLSAAPQSVLKDSATLSDAYQPTGKITFTLYDPSGTAVYTTDVVVNIGSGPYTTPDGFKAVQTGTWHWAAKYSGDTNNAAAESTKDKEPVKITAEGGVLAATGSTPGVEIFGVGLLGLGLLSLMAAGATLRLRRLA